MLSSVDGRCLVVISHWCGERGSCASAAGPASRGSWHAMKQPVTSPGKLLPTPGSPTHSSPTDQKRTFKQKLHNQLQDAQAAELIAARQQQLWDRKTLAVELLAQGRAHAYLDFFNLSQPAAGADNQPSSSSSGDPRGAAGTCSTSGRTGDTDLQQQSLILMKEQLQRADAAAAAGQAPEAYDAYRQLGLHFKQLGYRLRAQAFFKKCLRVSQQHDSQDPHSTATCVHCVLQRSTAACDEACMACTVCLLGV